MLGAAGQIPDTCTASQISDAVKHCRTASDKQGVQQVHDQQHALLPT